MSTPPTSLLPASTVPPTHEPMSPGSRSRRTVSGPRARGGPSMTKPKESNIGTAEHAHDGPGVEYASHPELVTETGDEVSAAPPGSTTPTSTNANTPSYAQPTTTSTSRRLPTAPSPSQLGPSSQADSNDSVNGKAKPKPRTPSRLKSASSIGSLRQVSSQSNMKGTATGSPKTPTTPTTPTRPFMQSHQSQSQRQSSSSSSSPSFPLPSPSPTKKSFASPSSLALSKKSSMGSMRSVKNGEETGRLRKSSGLSGRSGTAVVGAGAGAGVGSGMDGRVSEVSLRFGVRAVETGAREVDDPTVRIASPDESPTDPRTLQSEIFEEPHHRSHPPKSSQQAISQTSSALYGPSKRVPSTTTPIPTSGTDDRSPPRSPVLQNTHTGERTPERSGGSLAARRVSAGSRSPLEDGEIREEDETETTPKRGDRRDGGARMTSGSFASGAGDRDDVGGQVLRKMDEDPYGLDTNESQRYDEQYNDTRSGYVDRTDLNLGQTRQPGPSRTLSLAMGQRQPGDSPKDIRRWSRDSMTGLPPPPPSGFGSSMDMNMSRDNSFPTSSVPAHTMATMPAISRTSSFVRGDDANGLPGQDGANGYPSASRDGGEGTWGRTEVKEDSGGSSGSNKRRSGLPVEFRQDVMQDAPMRRSTMHARYTTDSSIPREPYAREPPSRLTGDSLIRSSSMRSGFGALSTGPNKRSSLMLQGTGRVYDQSMPSRSISVIGHHTDEWETGSMRSGLGGMGTTHIDRAESRRRRAVLLQSAGGGLSKLTPSRPGTSLRLRDPMSEPKQAPGGLLHTGSVATLRGGYQPDAPNSAPAHLRLHRQSLSLLPDRNGIASQMDSPLARYHRPMSRAATSMAGSVMMDSVSRYGGDTSSRYGDNDGASVRLSGSREFPLQGTPSRIYMTRLMAALRNASSSASRDMMEACLGLHEAMPPGLDENTVIRHKTQSTTTNADHISGHLKQALDLIAQMTVECEISAPEEAQEIALAYGDRLKGVLEGAMRESDSQIGGMTELFATMNGMVGEIGRESGQLAHRTRVGSGSSLGQSMSPSLYNLPRTGGGERSPSLLGGASMYRPKRSSLDLRRETTVAGSMASRNVRPGSALLFRNPHTTPNDEAGSSSGSSGTRTSRHPHRASESMSAAASSTSITPASEDRKRHSIISRLRTSPLRQTSMLPGESATLPNGSPPSASLSRAPTLRRQRSSASTATATARAPFKPIASGRAGTTTAVSQVTASPAEASFEDGVFVEGSDRGIRGGHRRLSSAASSVMETDVEQVQTTERTSRLAVLGGAYRRLSGVRGAK